VRTADRDDAGATALTTAMLFPVVLVMILLIIEAGLYFHAKQRAAAAADRAVAVSRWVDATEAQGEEAADAFLEGAPLLGADVAVDRPPGTGEVVATVTGSADGPLELGWTITATATAPLEQFIPEDERD
jgi:Flp pilus assembly protein TadG